MPYTDLLQPEGTYTGSPSRYWSPLLKRFNEVADEYARRSLSGFFDPTYTYIPDMRCPLTITGFLEEKLQRYADNREQLGRLEACAGKRGWQA